MTSAVPPFLTIPEQFLELTNWKIHLSNGEEFQDCDFVPNWDNATHLVVSREIGFDPIAVSNHLEVPEVDLEMLVFAGTGSGSLPSEKWLAFGCAIDGARPVAIQFDVDGNRLAGNLFLDTMIVLSHSPQKRTSPISPARAGDIVWRERRKMRLEGNVSRFPVSETDLSMLLGDEWRGALWQLYVDWSDPAADFDTAVRLHVNSRIKGFSERFRKGDAETLQAVMSDVIVQISREYLRQGDDHAGAAGSVSDTSLSAVAIHWIDSAFGSADNARRILEADPGRFHARLNALAALGV